MTRLATLALRCLAFSVPCLTQSEGVKVDEFGAITCEDFLARADNFFLALNNNPTAKGYLVISGGNEHILSARKYFQLLDAAIAERNYDRSRVEIWHSPGSKATSESFWIMSAGAAIPTSWSSKWNFRLPPHTRPFVWSTGFAEMCGSPVNISLLNQYLNANKGSYILVMIHSPNRIARRQERQEANDELRGIPRQRIRYSYRKSRGYTINIEKYWFIPGKS